MCPATRLERRRRSGMKACTRLQILSVLVTAAVLVGCARPAKRTAPPVRKQPVAVALDTPVLAVTEWINGWRDADADAVWRRTCRVLRKDVQRWQGTGSEAKDREKLRRHLEQEKDSRHIRVISARLLSMGKDTALVLVHFLASSPEPFRGTHVFGLLKEDGKWVLVEIPTLPL
jgi:hypothetical protein